MITVEDRAAELYGLVRGCTLCALAETRTHAVPGEGPLDAEVMCIGEAPGVNEDKQGRPFVGAAGQFLGELLAAAGLTREQVYICNVLKCRPPGNRDPMPNEIEACSEYLDVQLDMVDPRVVITLGRFSMSKWFPQQAISRIHGSVKEVDGRLIVPMYHPAAALHQGNLRQVLLDDFARVPAILERARNLKTAPRPEAATPHLAPPDGTPDTIEGAEPDLPAPQSPPESISTGEAGLTPREPGEEGPHAAPGPRPAEAVVHEAETAMIDESEQAAALPQPRSEGEAPTTDSAPAGPIDSSAAGKTEQIRLFE